jgi:hypothetical protein
MTSSSLVWLLLLFVFVNLARTQVYQPNPKWIQCPDAIRERHICQNNGVCYVNSKGEHPRCVCDLATQGKRCEIRIADEGSHRELCTQQEKREKKCLNGGKCFRLINDDSGSPIFACQCSPEYDGVQCEHYSFDNSQWDDATRSNSGSAGLDWDYSAEGKLADWDESLNQIRESIAKVLQQQDEEMMNAADAGNLREQAGVQEPGNIVNVRRTDLSFVLKPVDVKKLLRKMFNV